MSIIISLATTLIMAVPPEYTNEDLQNNYQYTDCTKVPDKYSEFYLCRDANMGEVYVNKPKKLTKAEQEAFDAERVRLADVRRKAFDEAEKRYQHAQLVRALEVAFYSAYLNKLNVLLGAFRDRVVDYTADLFRITQNPYMFPGRQEKISELNKQISELKKAITWLVEAREELFENARKRGILPSELQ